MTFVFTDVEGSTRLLHELGPARYAEALAQHRSVIRQAVTEHSGAEVDTQGDAFLLAFGTADEAAAAALAATGTLAEGPIRVRIGLHTGVPTLTDEGYVGLDVHRGARIAGLAHGGQIVLSSTAAALLDSYPLRNLGQHRLKDFDGAVRLYQLGGADFPPLRTPGSVDLPTPATRFLGRERELFEAVSLVYEKDPRVLTVLGPGGTGKTRFALELSRLLAEEAAGGTVFCALAPLREPALVLPTIAERLGAHTGEIAAITARIGDKRTHVVCDNVEHLLPDAARALGELAASIPSLRLLVTSREALHVQGEHELDLPPLADTEAVAFFCERAQAVRPDVEETDAVHRLCDRLDRLPLALELAAARTKLLAPETLLERLGQSLDLLKGARDMDERHATLRATIAWSYDLLDPDEQQLFRRLSVFRGGCTLETAEAVCDADLDTLASLLDKSLIRRRTGRLGEERFWMLETIREFAVERLAESADAEEIRRRHADRMLEITRSAHLTEEDDEPFQLPLVLAERDNVRAGLDWATEHDVELALELLIALENFWNVHATEEVLSRLERLLARNDGIPRALRARALRLRGGALHVLGSFDLCDAPYEESLALYRELGDERGVASLLQRLANSAVQRGELERARTLIDESQELARGRFPYTEIPNYTLLARIHVLTGDVEGGTALYQRCADMLEDLQWHWWRAGVLWFLALLALDRDDVDEAERLGDESLRLIRSDEGRRATFGPLTALARAARARGHLRRAGALWGAVEAENERAPSRAWLLWRTERAGPLLNETDPRFGAGVKEGRQLEIWDAVAIALGELELSQTEP